VTPKVTEARGRALFERVQVLAGFEANGAAGSNADLSASARIASNSGFAGSDVEDAEAAQLDAVAARECPLEAFKNGFDGGLGFYAGQSGTLNYLMYDVLLNQWLPPETATRNAAPSVLRRC